MVGARARPPSIAKEPFYGSRFSYFDRHLVIELTHWRAKIFLHIDDEQSSLASRIAARCCHVSILSVRKGLGVISERLFFKFVLGGVDKGWPSGIQTPTDGDDRKRFTELTVWCEGTGTNNVLVSSSRMDL